MLYFAYGSNMCTGRLRHPDRVPSARVVCKAILVEHAFRFHKRSADGSAKADAFYTGNAGDAVWGVLFEINPREKLNLDRAEGLGYGYGEKPIVVSDSDGERRRTFMYAAEAGDIDPRMQPYAWYKRFVIEGARQHGLQADYVAQIEAMPAVEDPDRARDAENRAIKC